jgi:hypothetical protein
MSEFTFIEKHYIGNPFPEIITNIYYIRKCEDIKYYEDDFICENNNIEDYLNT